MTSLLDSFAHLPVWLYPVLFVAGAIAGVMNTVGGGGSVITLPILMFAGLPADIANATNRIGIIAQNAVAVHGFRKAGVRGSSLGLRLVIATSIGAVVGAALAVAIDDRTFRTVLGVLMLFLLPLIVFRPKPHLLKDGAPPDPWQPLGFWSRVGLVASFFGLGVYGGFIQAGMGLMVLFVLGWFLRMDLVRANYIKLLVTFGPQVVALIVFMAGGVGIDLAAGLLMALGQIVGAKAGTWIAIKKGERVIITLLAVSILLSSGELLGLRQWLIAMLTGS